MTHDFLTQTEEEEPVPYRLYLKVVLKPTFLLLAASSACFTRAVPSSVTCCRYKILLEQIAKATIFYQFCRPKFWHSMHAPRRARLWCYTPVWKCLPQVPNPLESYRKDDTSLTGRPPTDYQKSVKAFMSIVVLIIKGYSQSTHNLVTLQYLIDIQI